MKSLFGSDVFFVVSRRHAGSADFGAVQLGTDGAPHLLQSEVQLLSLKHFEWPLVVRYGGLVMSKSVKVRILFHVLSCFNMCPVLRKTSQ